MDRIKELGLSIAAGSEAMKQYVNAIHQIQAKREAQVRELDRRYPTQSYAVD